MLFGGLITLPMWGYYHTSNAMLELMMCDTPHIQYHPKDKFDENKVMMMDEVNKAKVAKAQKEGLAAFGLNMNFKEATAEEIKEK